MSEKQRLDVLLVDRQLAPSRTKASAMIMAAEVSVEGQIIDKPGTRISADAEIRLKSKPKYVGRGGLKLEGALETFSVNVKEIVCADVGASTGGFTDCLLQNGAKRVYAIDVGYNIIDYRLRIDDRVILLENTNARYLEELDEPIDLAVIDVSFISLKLILPAVQQWLSDQADVIALIKPQFEAGKQDVGKGGIVRNPNVRKRILEDIPMFAEELGFTVIDLIRSPITGQKGNVEYLVWLTWGKSITPTTSYSYIDKIPLIINDDQ